MNKVFVNLLICNMLMAASYEDFVDFVKTKAPSFHDEELWRMFYDTFLEGLTPSESPFLYAIGGGPASGKTTLRNQCHFSNVHLHDMDEIVVRLPEYKRDCVLLGLEAAFDKWFPTAREIADTMAEFALANRYSILYDRTCAAERSYYDILRASQLGYRVSLIGLCLDLQKALDRARRRAVDGGRALSEPLIREWHARFSAIWPYYLRFVQDVSLYDTGGPTPRLIYSSELGVQDPILYQQFLDDGAPFEAHYNHHLKQHIP